MAKIWANRLIAGTKQWDEVPISRKYAVREELRDRVEAGQLSDERYEEITGEPFDDDSTE